MRMTLRVLIVDDNESFLGAARTLLERQGLSIVGLATTIAEARQQAGELRPDVVLVDISLGAESGFDLAHQLVEEDLDGTATVILTSTHAEADFADLIGESPAAGFVPKSHLSATAIVGILGAR
jgi:DNA-binding NarL/FixJ family response regulator